MSRSKLAPSLFVVAAGLIMAACVDNGDSTVVILQNQVPGEACTVSGSETDTFISAGVIDARSTSGYVFTPLVKNFATAEAGQERLRIAFVEGARVEITFLQDPDLFTETQLTAFREAGLTRFEVPMTGPIDPEGTSSFVFEIVPPELLAQIAEKLPFTDNGFDRTSTLLQVAIRLVGSLGDDSFESQLYRYPVDVCVDCLINDLGACNALATSFVPTNTGGACNTAQDYTVDCCSDDTGLVCPAVGTMPSAAQ
jgi:hypothetical protein